MGYAEAQYTIDELNKVNGLAPNQVNKVKVIIKNGNTLINFNVEDSVIDGQIICYVGKVVVVRKVGSAPEGIEDGTVVLTVDREYMHNYVYDPYVIEEYTDIGYYAFFTISDHGVLNKKPIVKQSVTIITKFAYHQDFTELNPDKTITYLDWGDLNSSAEPMHTNGDTGEATYGDFEGFFTLQQNKPYMVKSDFTADYALNPDDYTKKLDDSASDVSNTSYEGLGAFAWMPKFYMKEIYAQDGNSRDVYFSNEKEDEDFQPVGFVDYSVGEVEGLWIPMYYPITRDNGMVKSFGNTNEEISYDTPGNIYTKYLVKTGSNARFLGGSIMSALRDLEYGLYKSTDVQKHGGYGGSHLTKNSGSDNYGIANQIISNGIVSGFYGTGNSSDQTTMNKANKAFHSNVLFSYFYSLVDPYTRFYTPSSTARVGRVCIASTYYYAPKVSHAKGDIQSSGYDFTMPYGILSKLKKLTSKYDANGIPQSINYGSANGSISTGLCDFSNSNSTGQSGSVCFARRLASVSYRNENNGPGCVDIGEYYADSSYCYAPLIIPPAGYTPS